MKRGDLLLITILAALGVLIVLTINVLTVLAAPEWIKFVAMIVLMALLLVGSFWFVIPPFSRRR